MAVHEKPMVQHGLQLLGWLVDTETHGGHLSPTGTAGRGPGDPSPQYDQQPLEASSLAGACAFAYRATGDDRWRDAVALAWGWFLGDNDADEVMFDPATGAGYDGISPAGRSINCGAESTLAVHAALQAARRVGVATSWSADAAKP